jgi:hypothetical protein
MTEQSLSNNHGLSEAINGRMIKVILSIFEDKLLIDYCANTYGDYLAHSHWLPYYNYLIH